MSKELNEISKSYDLFKTTIWHLNDKGEKRYITPIVSKRIKGAFYQSAPSNMLIWKWVNNGAHLITLGW